MREFYVQREEDKEQERFAVRGAAGKKGQEKPTPFLYWADCSWCGWKGPQRSTAEAARVDLLAHKRGRKHKVHARLRRRAI